MTEKELIKGGFIKIDVPKTESGDTTDYYYYSYIFDNGWIITSCSNDETENNSWSVYLDNVDNMRIYNMPELVVLINLIKKWLRSQKCG